MTALRVLQGAGIATMILALVVIVRADDTTGTAFGVLQLLGGAGMLLGGRWGEQSRAG